MRSCLSCTTKRELIPTGAIYCLIKGREVPPSEAIECPDYPGEK